MSHYLLFYLYFVYALPPTIPPLFFSDILQNLNNYCLSHPSTLLTQLAHAAEKQMGGTSGALYCLLFTSGATELKSADEGETWLHIWARVLRSCLKCLMKYGKAKPGDRSMVCTP